MAHSRTYLPPRGWPPRQVSEVDRYSVLEFLQRYADGRPMDSITVGDVLELTAIARERTVRQRYPQVDFALVDHTAFRSICGPYPTPDFCTEDGFIPVRIVATTSHRKRAPARLIVATPWPSDEVIRGIESRIRISTTNTALEGVAVEVHVCTAEEFAKTMDALHTLYPRPRMGPGRTHEEFAVREAVATANARRRRR